MGKLNNSLNGNNFGCVKDRVLIFGSRVWFSEMANLMVLFNFTPDPPWLPWQRNLGHVLWLNGMSYWKTV